jgi:hypothetical protein
MTAMRRSFPLALVVGTVLVAALLTPAAAAASTRPPAGPSAAAALPPPTPCPAPGCWHPAVRTSWQIQLTGKIVTTVAVQMFEIDLFDHEKDGMVGKIHAKGAKVVCYVSAGSWEDWRPDAGSYPAVVLGRSNGWPGEKWVDIRRLDILGPILEARMDRCDAAGFDGIDFDNVDGYTNTTGFPLTANDQLAFNTWLANEAHERGLAVALKNDLDQIPTLVPYFDMAVNEQCAQYDECSLLTPFVTAGKPVFQIEYSLATTKFCPNANRMNFNALKKKLSLNAYRVACR